MRVKENVGTSLPLFFLSSLVLGMISGVLGLGQGKDGRLWRVKVTEWRKAHEAHSCRSQGLAHGRHAMVSG
jgi:hypothetical protein